MCHLVASPIVLALPTRRLGGIRPADIPTQGHARGNDSRSSSSIRDSRRKQLCTDACHVALVTNFIGVHTVLGAFVAGIMIGQSPILTKHIEEQLRGLIVALFMPIFFGVAGLAIDLKVLSDRHLLGLALIVIGIASIGKLGGCYLGSRLARLNHPEALAVGFAMNARGSTEVILATIGLTMGVLNQQLFTVIVLMAVATTICMPPLLRWALARVPIGMRNKPAWKQRPQKRKMFCQS